MKRCDRGPQLAAVERLIDEKVAEAYVDVDQYAEAEKLCDGYIFSIADELNLPVWVVQA